MSLDPSHWFPAPLWHMGDAHPALRGIFQPVAARDVAPVGVTAQFLEHAAEYHARYANVGHFRMLLDDALGRLDPPLAPRAMLDIGSGAGNSVIPLLERFPDAVVLATDISPQLLAILRDHLEANPGYRGRFALLCVDASSARYVPGSFDLAVGAAILHHVPDPRAVLDGCAHALRPRGAAIFFEPFELGHAMLRLAYADILAEAGRRGDDAPGFAVVRRLHDDYVARADARHGARLLELDDKWMFNARFFAAAARDESWGEWSVRDIHSHDAPLADETRVNLRLGGGLAEDGLPRWAWERLRAFEQAFSPDARRDLPFEAAVVLRASVVRRPQAQAGWWFDAAQPGRGFFVLLAGERGAVACCHYGEGGEPVWEVAGPGPFADATLDLRTARTPSPAAGTALRLAFDGEARAMLDWAGERITLVPQHPGSPGWTAGPGSGLGGWWTEDRDAATVDALVEFLGDHVFAAVLRATDWCVTVAARRDVLRYAGEWLRFSGGQALHGPYRAPGDPERLGVAELMWNEHDRLVLQLPGGRQTVLRRRPLAGG